MRDNIRNEVIRNKVGVAPIKGKMREARLTWFKHDSRRVSHAPVRKRERIFLRDVARRGRRNLRRPKKN